jgi:hypothetical protein
MLLASSSPAVPMTNGVTQTMGNVLPQSGVTSYKVYYSYPSAALVGTNLTVSLSLRLNQFEGNVEYINHYSLGVDLQVGQEVLQKTIDGPYGINTSLYPGATWGPENFTFPLTESDTGVAPGTSENATLLVTLEDTTFVQVMTLEGIPGIAEVTEPAMQASAGSLIIENPVASHAGTAGIGWVAVGAAGGAAVVLVGAAAFLLRKRRASGPPNEPPHAQDT